MRKSLGLWVLAALALFAVPGSGGEKKMAPIDCSLFVASGSKLTTIVHSQKVAATPDKVFESWTTPAGIKAFLGVDANVELRIGGPMELYFGAGLPEGQRGSEGCRILSYLPHRMLSFSWNAPPTLPVERAKRSWVVVMLKDNGDGTTNVEVTHTGFGEGGNWDKVQTYFDRAWKNVLGALAARYAK